MKVNLVVASGAHVGKVIPVAKQDFLIGRDPHCQLRPASQAISKQHCGIHIRQKSVYLKDYGSTNGTFLNDKQLEANQEQELKAGDKVRVGPLDFTMEIVVPRPSDSTPLPDALNQANSSATEKLQAAAGVKSGTQPVPVKRAPIAAPKASGEDSEDEMAAMLLGMDADGGVPEGSTVFEMAALNPDGTPKKDDKAAAANKTKTPETSSQAASDILRKFMKRPR